MNQDMIKFVDNILESLTKEKAIKLLSEKIGKSEKVINATDKLIDAYESTKDLNNFEARDVFELFAAYVYIDKKQY